MLCFYSRNGGKVVDMLKVAAVVAVVCVLLVPVMLWSDDGEHLETVENCLWMVSHLVAACRLGFPFRPIALLQYVSRILG